MDERDFESRYGDLLLEARIKDAENSELTEEEKEGVQMIRDLLAQPVDGIYDRICLERLGQTIINWRYMTIVQRAHVRAAHESLIRSKR